MSSNLVINIIGGVCGGAITTYVSGKIHDYIHNEPQPSAPSPSPSPSQPQKYDLKFKDAKSFEDIYKIQLKEQIDNVNKYNYDYDNEHGNTVEIREKPAMFVNDYLNDNDCTFLTALGRDNN
jgi:hypothetical protein